MIIAIDHGNYSIKTPHYVFLAGLSEHTVRPLVTDEVLEYQGRFWTLSGRRLSYMRDKTQDDRYFILTLFAIGKELANKELGPGPVDIELAVGLPPEHFGVLKERFAGYLKREGVVHFDYGGRALDVVIGNVMVYPQAYAAAVLQSSQVLREPNLFLVDIGGYTTDVLLLRRGRPDLQFCRSLESGIITMNNEIIRKIGAQYDLRLEDEHISAVLRGNASLLPKEVQREIRTEAENHAKDILDQLRELQVDLRVNPVRFLGGGSMLLKPFLEASPLVTRAEFSDSPCDNAIGYEMLARAALSKK